MKAAFDKTYVTRLDGPNVKADGTKWDWAQELREDIKNTIAKSGATRAVMV